MKEKKTVEWQEAWNWKGIWLGFNSLEERVERDWEGGRLTGSQAGLIRGFISDLKDVLSELEKLEVEIVSKGIKSPDPVVRDVFKDIFNRLHSIAIGTSPLREGKPNWLLNEVWGHGIKAATNFLERRAEEIGVESWSLGATVGFPSGVSGTIIINFKRFT